MEYLFNFDPKLSLMEAQGVTKAEFSFVNTEIAFKHKSVKDLKKARMMFSAFNLKWLLRIGPPMANFSISVGLPVKGLIKNTVFAQFCGGESIEDCAETIAQLNSSKIGTILDYSVEGQESENVFDATMAEIIRTIDYAAKNPSAHPYAVFKVTGIARQAILEKASKNLASLKGNDLAEYQRVENRFNKLVDHAAECGIKIFIDAEETWLQPIIDHLTEVAMQKHNKGQCIVFNTLQMYRHDRLDYLKKQIEKAKEHSYHLGFKLVRGAYMEKERLRAEKMNYPSPIQPTKADTDRDYDAAIKVCIENLSFVELCAGTHNEKSSELLSDLMIDNHVESSDKRIYFAQLLGMSDNISYNLANAGYNVAKYVPYGPVKEVLPYLARRAEENSSVKGQAGRELTLIDIELKRRNQHK